MFQNAVSKHDAKAAIKRPLSQLFSSSPPIPAEKPKALPSEHLRQAARSHPLSNGSANVVKQPSFHTASVNGTQNGHAGFKRTASGLAKALNRGSSFSGSLSSNKTNPIIIDDASNDIFFDENDFDSDIDLDVEDPASKGIVKYPTLPPVPPPFVPTPSRRAPHTDLNVSGTHDSSYVTQLLPNSAQKGRATKTATTQTPSASSEPLPWSSSPVAHYKKLKQPLNLEQFAYDPTPSATTQEPISPEKPPVKKKMKRNLPWVVEEERAVAVADETKMRGNIVAGNHRLKNAQTPVPSKNSTLPWTATASAIKEQQKILREATKKPTRDAVEDVVPASAQTGKPKETRISRVFLSDEQRHVLELVSKKNKSVFFTGSAGTGKSVLLREIISALRKKHIREPDRIAVTASTGLAACNVGGVTLHSFAGIGLGKEAVPELVKKIKRNQKAKHRWMRTKVLIIDEISMVDGDLFDKLEGVARTIRNNGRPFGGIQIVITGDFFQLPPVPDYGRIAKFAFDAQTWNTCIEHTIGLHHVFRQKDPEFAGMLNEMREGRLTPASIAKFKAMNKELSFEDEMEATEL